MAMYATAAAILANILYQDKKWLKENYIDQRLTLDKVSKLYGVSRRTMCRMLKKYNIPIRSIGKAQTKIGKINKEWVRKKYWDEKLTLKQIGKICGVTNVTIKNWMIMFNIPRRSRSECQIGRKMSEKAKHKMSSKRKRENNSNWRGGVSTLYHLIRTNIKSRQWRSDVFTRDKFTCQMCGDDRGHNLRAHHKISFIKILQKYEITTLKEALECAELWNLNNGITLCEECHKKIHEKVGDVNVCNAC